MGTDHPLLADFNARRRRHFAATVALALFTLSLLVLAYNNYNLVRHESRRWSKVLYDFTVEYKPVLAEWAQKHRENALKPVATDTTAILLTLTYPPIDTQVVAGGVAGDSVPFLRAYLQEKMDVFSPRALHFQGLNWESDAVMYPVWWFPFVLMLFLIRNAWELTKLRRQLLKSGDVRTAAEADTLVFLPLLERRLGWRPRVWIWCAALFGLSFMSVSFASRVAMPSVDARLYVEPLRPPDILRMEMSHVHTFLRMDGTAHPLENPATLILLDLAAAITLAVVLARNATISGLAPGSR